MMLNSLLKQTIFSKRIKLINKKRDLYKKITTNSDIEKYQLKQFNIIWAKAIAHNPFYMMWQKKYNLPNKINNLEELKSFPILTKKDIQENQDLIFNHLDNYNTISTGGSTGEPTKFPVSKEESDFNYANNYMAKSWWRLEPLDDILLFWGHSHLFGTGIKGQINQYKRILSDWLINTKRLNAYDMSVDTLSKYYEEYKKYNPKFIIGYTSSIYKLAKYIKENNLILYKNRNLKGVVITSETVTEYDIDIIEEVFKVPCIIEYGMAETGVIAYAKNNSKNIKLFWDSFIGLKDDEDNLLITTISNKLFPLINYRTDDIIKSSDTLSILTIEEIMGRKKDILKVKSKNEILELSGILMIHLLKSYKGIVDIQFEQLNDGKVKILFSSYETLDIKKISKYFIENINIDHKDITKECFQFIQVDNIEKTIAGKSKWIK